MICPNQKRNVRLSHFRHTLFDWKIFSTKVASAANVQRNFKPRKTRASLLFSNSEGYQRRPGFCTTSRKLFFQYFFGSNLSLLLAKKQLPATEVNRKHEFVRITENRYWQSCSSQLNRDSRYQSGLRCRK